MVWQQYLEHAHQIDYAIIQHMAQWTGNQDLTYIRTLAHNQVRSLRLSFAHLLPDTSGLGRVYALHLAGGFIQHVHLRNIHVDNIPQ